MTAKQLAINLIENAYEALFRSARAMTAEQLDIRVGEACRTPLEILQECVQSLSWPQTMLAPGGFQFNPEEYQKSIAKRSEWTTVDKCEEVARISLTELVEFVRNYPEDDLDRRIKLPFGEHLEPTVGEILVSPYWNMTYHLGQINFVQMTYGDKEMH